MGYGSSGQVAAKFIGLIVLCGDWMLETPQERVKLLKAGIDSKTIEKLYLVYNDFKIVLIATHFELVEIKN
jgi:hypothetical protein